MNIRHRRLFDTDAVIKHYTKKDGVPISYVCTSSVNFGTLAYDIFYRGTPHPEFGNYYFGLYRNLDNVIMITNADTIETVSFTMVKVKKIWHYSQHRWDYNIVNNHIAIDGGRAYTKIVGSLNKYKIKNFIVKNGKFVKSENN